MAAPTKIATCNYCGTRAALVLSGTVRHELTCGNCGAPLHDMKALPMAKKRKKAADQPKYGISHRAPPEPVHPPKYRKKKKRKGVLRAFFEEAFDVIEDILD
jgi:hypothetical protein